MKQNASRPHAASRGIERWMERLLTSAYSHLARHAGLIVSALEKESNQAGGSWCGELRNNGGPEMAKESEPPRGSGGQQWMREPLVPVRQRSPEGKPRVLRCD